MEEEVKQNTTDESKEAATGPSTPPFLKSPSKKTKPLKEILAQDSDDSGNDWNHDFIEKKLQERGILQKQPQRQSKLTELLNSLNDSTKQEMTKESPVSSSKNSFSKKHFPAQKHADTDIVDISSDSPHTHGSKKKHPKKRIFLSNYLSDNDSDGKKQNSEGEGMDDLETVAISSRDCARLSPKSKSAVILEQNSDLEEEQTTSTQHNSVDPAHFDAFSFQKSLGKSISPLKRQTPKSFASALKIQPQEDQERKKTTKGKLDLFDLFEKKMHYDDSKIEEIEDSDEEKKKRAKTSKKSPQSSAKLAPLSSDKSLKSFFQTAKPSPKSQRPSVPIVLSDDEEKPSPLEKKSKITASPTSSSKVLSPSSPKPKIEKEPTVVTLSSEDEQQIPKESKKEKRSEITKYMPQLSFKDGTPSSTSKKATKKKKSSSDALNEFMKMREIERKVKSRKTKKKNQDEEYESSRSEDEENPEDAKDLQGFICSDNVVETFEDKTLAIDEEDSLDFKIASKKKKKQQSFPFSPESTTRDDDSKSRLLLGSSSLRDSFQIFLQYVISCCLNEDFIQDLQELETKQYFQPSINRIKDAVVGRKESLLSSSAWNSAFKKDLESFPEYHSWNRQDIGESVRCQACNRSGHVAIAEVVFMGSQYQTKLVWNLVQVPPIFDSPSVKPPTEQHQDEGEEGNEQEKEVRKQDKSVSYRLGKFCHLRSELFHRLQHYVYGVFMQVNKKLNSYDHSQWEEAQILDELLSDSSWVKSMYQELQILLDTADAFGSE